MAVLKSCVVCGRPSPAARCPAHKKVHVYSTAEYQMNRLVVLARGVCSQCGKPGTKEDPLEPDHIVEVSKGGTSAITNLRALHRSENRSRGARLGNGVST